MKNKQKISNVLRKLEKLDQTWTCEMKEKDDSGKVISIKQTHLRSVPPATGKMLKSLIVISNSKKILELGCSGGYSTIWMALGAIETGGRIITTEILPEKVKFARQNFKDACVDDKITLYEGDIFEVLRYRTLPKLDLVFIDADKSQYVRYYKGVFPLLKNGGIIIVDNIISHASGLKDFIQMINGDKNISFEIIPIDSGLLIAKKK